VVKPKHLVRNPNGEIAAFVDIRIVRHWPYTPGTHRLRTEDHDFPDGAGEIPSGAGNAPGGTSITGPLRSWAGLFRVPSASTPASRSTARSRSASGPTCMALESVL
jgi:hypothetical protein